MKSHRSFVFATVGIWCVAIVVGGIAYGVTGTSLLSAPFAVFLLTILVGMSLNIVLFRSILGSSALRLERCVQLLANDDHDAQLRECEEFSHALAFQEQFASSAQAGSVNEERVQSLSNQLGELSAMADEITHSVRQQTETLAKTAHAMADMASASSVAIPSFRELIEKTNLANQRTHEGSGHLDKAVVSIGQINEKTGNLGATIEELSQSSSKITGILSSINDIADQTNLLALNAAIEAARAGEAGRGFSVVADEVRKLAERTQLATREVSSIVDNLYQETQSASSEMGKARSLVDEGVAVIATTSGIFKDIMDLSQEIDQSNGMVGYAAIEQDRNIQALNKDLQEITAEVSNALHSIGEFERVVREVQQQVSDLRNDNSARTRRLAR
ncbi:methyl-accepting chemotaxis protein [Chrysiogenes arsenatis]|uniref:methyl-accepting chemotaxis protein n=1 Tax=Chrysiogenes arsenatis TaxID=309797 RepID=UPI0003FD0A7C|nr:methyl-accepting chemotaxis protein [Chrysiogenes arsenatis]